MLRLAIIVTTILATTFGSLGLPIYLHTCRMMAMEMEPAACPMCSASEDGRPVVPASGHDDDGSCCNDAVVNQRIDPGTVARAEMPLPVFVGLVTFLAIELGAPEAPESSSSRLGHSPPALAGRTQHTYLHNSSFLI